jgi:hypothetical protein
VPVIAHPLLVALDGVDHPVLPGGGVAPLGRGREAKQLSEGGVDLPAARGLIRHLPEKIRQVVKGVDDLADIGLLQRLDARVQRQDLVVQDRADPDPVEVVGRVEGVPFDVVGRRAEVQGPAVEEHHPDVDAAPAGGDDAVAEPLEERLVEAVQVEAGLAVGGRSRAGPRPGLGGHAEVEVAPGGLRPELLPAPQPDEVVAVLDQEVEVGAIVQLLGGLGASPAGTHAVVQVVPDVRAGQIHRPLTGGVADATTKGPRAAPGFSTGLGELLMNPQSW